MINPKAVAMITKNQALYLAEKMGCRIVDDEESQCFRAIADEGREFDVALSEISASYRNDGRGLVLRRKVLSDLLELVTRFGGSHPICEAVPQNATPEEVAAAAPALQPHEVAFTASYEPSDSLSYLVVGPAGRAQAPSLPEARQRAAEKAGVKLRNFTTYIVYRVEPGVEPREMANWVNGKRVKR